MRRLLASVAAAALLVAVPVAAQAYVAPGYALRVSDSTPGVGVPFQAVFSGATAGEDYTLTITSDPASIPSGDIEIAGTSALTRTAAGDTVTYTVTLRSPGTYRLEVTDASGALLADSSVVVRAAGTGAAASTGGGLAVTGSDPLVLGLGAAAVIALGVGAVVAIRRRQASTRV